MPDGWAWCRLGEIGNTNIGLTYHPVDLGKTGTPVLRANNIQNDKLCFEELARVNTKILENQYVSEGDILICARNGSKSLVGKCTIIDGLVEKMAFGAFMAIFRSNYNHYIVRYLQSNYFKDYLRESNSTQIYQLTQAMLKNALIPLPPYNEQHRIVSSIENTFVLINIIEENKSDLQTTIKQAKSKILDLAIHGKLVPQDPADEPAEELLKRIATSDNRPYKKIEEDVPFSIPESWIWCTGNDLFNPMTSKKPDGEIFRYIDIDAIDNKNHCVIQPKSIAVTDAPSRASRELNNGDVLFSLVRPYLENIALIEKENSDCIASTGFYICKPKKIILPKFLFYLMISEYVIKGLNQFMKGDNSPSINGDDIKNWLYPLPPLAEQHRIVTKIEEIFQKFDKISKELTK